MEQRFAPGNMQKREFTAEKKTVSIGTTSKKRSEGEKEEIT